MSKTAHALKHATPKRKYQYMNMVLDFRADIKEHQKHYVPTVTTCTICGGEVEKSPMKEGVCYDCYRNITAAVIIPEYDELITGKRELDDDQRAALHAEYNARFTN